MDNNLKDALDRFAKQYQLEPEGVAQFYEKIPEELKYKWQDVMRDVMREVHKRESWIRSAAKDGRKLSLATKT